jgi:hypothetical protein
MAVAAPVALRAEGAGLGEAGLLRASASLRPGEYLWDDLQPVSGGGVSLHVSIRDQRLYVYRGGTLVAVSTVSTGMPGHRTPTGEFSVLQKRVWHRSNLYSNAPMPYMQRLTWGGIALHAGHNPGYPASHGCIRLPHAFARRLFGETALGTRVKMTDRFDGTVYYLEVDNEVFLYRHAEPSFTPVAGGERDLARASLTPTVVTPPTAPRALPVPERATAAPLVLRYDVGANEADTALAVPPKPPAAAPPPPDPWNGTVRPHWMVR